MIILAPQVNHRQSRANLGRNPLALTSNTPVDIGVNHANIGRQNQQAHSSLLNWSNGMTYISVKNEEYDGL